MYILDGGYRVVYSQNVKEIHGFDMLLILPSYSHLGSSSYIGVFNSNSMHYSNLDNKED